MSETGLIPHPDGCPRCPWAGLDPLYVAYHDTEWGVPEHDGRALFEKLILDGFQAGLSWITILRQREAFRGAFAGFDPERIARFDGADVEALMAGRRHHAQPRQDRGHHRGRAGLAARSRRAARLRALLWDFVDGAPDAEHRPEPAEIPAETPVSRAISKA